MRAARPSEKKGVSTGSKESASSTPTASRICPKAPLSERRSSSQRTESTVNSSGNTSSADASLFFADGFGRKTRLISKNGDWATPCATFVRLAVSRPGISERRRRFSCRRTVFWTTTGSASVQGEMRLAIASSQKVFVNASQNPRLTSTPRARALTFSNLLTLPTVTGRVARSGILSYP